MISLDNMRVYLDSLNIPEEEKQDLITLLEPSFDFRAFLSQKMNISSLEVESLINARIASRRTELNSGLEGLDRDDYISLAVTRMSKIIRDFAEEEGYEHCEALQISIEKIMLIGLQQRMATQVENN